VAVGAFPKAAAPTLVFQGSNEIQQLVFSPDGRTLASRESTGGRLGRIHVWSARTLSVLVRSRTQLLRPQPAAMPLFEVLGVF
jgi:WD40 repeat protein